MILINPQGSLKRLIPQINLHITAWNQFVLYFVGWNLQKVPAVSFHSKSRSRSRWVVFHPPFFQANYQGYQGQLLRCGSIFVWQGPQTVGSAIQRGSRQMHIRPGLGGGFCPLNARFWESPFQSGPVTSRDDDITPFIGGWHNLSYTFTRLTVGAEYLLQGFLVILWWFKSICGKTLAFFAGVVNLCDSNSLCLQKQTYKKNRPLDFREHPGGVEGWICSSCFQLWELYFLRKVVGSNGSYDLDRELESPKRYSDLSTSEIFQKPHNGYQRWPCFTKN